MCHITHQELQQKSPFLGPKNHNASCAWEAQFPCMEICLDGNPMCVTVQQRQLPHRWGGQEAEAAIQGNNNCIMPCEISQMRDKEEGQCQNSYAQERPAYCSRHVCTRDCSLVKSCCSFFASCSLKWSPFCCSASCFCRCLLRISACLASASAVVCKHTPVSQSPLNPLDPQAVEHKSCQ